MFIRDVTSHLKAAELEQVKLELVSLIIPLLNEHSNGLRIVKLQRARE